MLFFFFSLHKDAHSSDVESASSSDSDSSSRSESDDDSVADEPCGLTVSCKTEASSFYLMRANRLHPSINCKMRSPLDSITQILDFIIFYVFNNYLNSSLNYVSRLKCTYFGVVANQVCVYILLNCASVCRLSLGWRNGRTWRLAVGQLDPVHSTELRQRDPRGP